MTEHPEPPEATGSRGDRPRDSKGWFRALWRWHFYGAFLVTPVLLILSVTGLIYLFRFQLDPMMNPEVLRVEAPASGATARSFDDQLRAVQEKYPQGLVTSMTEPGAANEPTRFVVEGVEASALHVYVDPWTAQVTGALNPDTTLSGYAIKIHGELMAGPLGDGVVELAASWAIVMALTGYFLFFRGRKARKRGRGKQMFWRRTHAWVGAVSGVGLLFLLVSGLPWTGVWGQNVQNFATANGSSFWGSDPGAISDPKGKKPTTLDQTVPEGQEHEVPWGSGKSEVPESAGAAAGGGRITVDEAAGLAVKQGLRQPLTMTMPLDEMGVYSAMGYAFNDPSKERTVHIDQYSGKVRATYGYDDYPMLSKVVSQGIGLHEGRSLGIYSMIGATLMCLAIIASCLTGPIIWWRRRRGGSIGAPRGRLPVGSTPLLAVAMVALGVFLPLFGLSLVLVLILDQLVLRRVKPLGAWFDVS